MVFNIREFEILTFSGILLGSQEVKSKTCISFSDIFITLKELIFSKQLYKYGIIYIGFLIRDSISNNSSLDKK